GLTATCDQTVTVNDTTPPTITCPANVTVSANASCEATGVALGSPTTADNCGVASVTNNAPATFPLGATIVTWTVTDNAGLTATCDQTVTVNDTTPPTITCPANITVNTSDDGTGNCTTTANIGTPTVSDNCSSSGNVIITAKIGGVIINPATYIFSVGNTTVVWTATDEKGNISIPCNQIVTVVDNEYPTASNPAPITASGSAPDPDITVVIDEADNCTASPVVAWVSDTPSGSCPVIVTRIYSVTDNANNSINVTQTITVNDAIPPVVNCIAPYTLTITLDSITGEATITADQIDDGSADNCDLTPLLSLDRYTFGCNDIGTNTVTLTVTDSQDNFDTCQTIITVNAPTINSGILTGWNMMTETSADASDIIELTACPVDSNGNTIAQDVELNLSGIDPALTDDINRWEYSTNGGVTWSTLTGTINTTLTYTLVDVQVTTLVRTVIDVGDCLGFSPVAIISVIPPDIPPTIINNPDTTICLGESVLVQVESQYGVGSDINEGGLFQIANPEDWRINGIDNWKLPASNSNEKNYIWAEVTNQNGGRNMNGILYNAAQPKYIIVHGDLTDPSIKRNGQPWNNTWSTLETPIFSLYGLTEATLMFDTAYYLEAGAYIKVEFSVDGGNTYDTVLDPGINTFDGQPHNFTGPSTSGAGTHMANFVPISIDLQNYVGLSNLRVRFTFEGGGSTGSSWALDNVQIPNRPVDEVIQWTDNFGTVVTTGSSVNIQPVTPGVQNYGATSLINGCRSEDNSGTQFITVEATLSYAGENIVPIVNECGEDTVTLHAYDNSLTAQQNYDNGVWNNNYKVPNIAPISPDYPGTGEIGTWSVTSAPSACGTGSYSFSDVNDPNAIFTGEPGTYTLTWTVNGCASNVQVTINSCSQIDFDGVNDYITFKDNYDRTGPFSIEMWIKANSLTGAQSLLSKRDANDLSTGYDLRLNGSTVEFRWNTNSISSNAIDATTWHHIAVTFNGSTYKLYLDGVERASANGSVPGSNNMECILGAMDQANNPPNKPVNYYHGWIDELRIWNKALDAEHIHQMMNQEIKLDGGDDVMGEIIPLKIHGQDADQNGTDDNPLLWSDLDGYYRMDINCGYLTPTKGSLNGRLRNIYSDQDQTAPLPYISANNGLWDNNNTWAEPTVWYTPNSSLFGTKIDWNIVEVKNNIESGNNDITVLGLFVDNGFELTIQDPTPPYDETNTGQGLWVTHYLKLDGFMDLVGESQLVQKRYNTFGNPTVQFNESVLEPTSSGLLKRDQQGTVNKYNYNYWSFPVGERNPTSNNVPSIIQWRHRDGTDSNNPKVINWLASGRDASPTSPLSIPEYWLYSYENYTSNTYGKWVKLNRYSAVKVGLGYTMKGSGATGSYQNYSFIGKPNNDIIKTAITAGNDALVGNPYPSAIDAREFIKDNIPTLNPDGNPSSANPGTTGSIDGSLNFWIHYTTNNTHLLNGYQGGYATYTLAGGLEPVTSPLLTEDGYYISGQGYSNLRPGHFIPIAQGFFVHSAGTNKTGNELKFQNSQRFFKTEAYPNDSQFLKSSASKTAKSSSNPTIDETAIKRVRLQFKTPEGARRHLLLAFTSDNEATDGFDYGYDAKSFDNLPNDMLFMINDEKYVIQAVGAFNETKQYPLGIFSKTGGAIEISVTELENLDPNTKVYIYDSLLGTYTKINEKNSKYETTLDVGNYLNRFFITFVKNNSLSVADEILEHVQVNYLQNSGEIYIKTTNGVDVKQVNLVNILGQNIKAWNPTNTASFSNDMKIPIGHVSEGSYIINVLTTSGSVNKKVVINQ
ncbi:LamG-like jellyroll fold domain-containing protein, partial [Gaetbulibacter sp. M235]|uniref:LamG-like jellyroll fold domain-containing protein n=1 Tax=Gaetbulibacter sp. M235 TaxID=3126510 RepID=UPI00374E71AA